MLTTNAPRLIVNIGISMVWSASAWAATPVLAVATPSLLDIPVTALIAGLGLAFVGGAARTAQKMAKQQIQKSLIPITIFSDCLTAMAVGMATFFLVTWREFAPLLQAFVILASGYGGSTVLEKYVTAIMRRIDGNYESKGAGDVKS